MDGNMTYQEQAEHALEAYRQRYKAHALAVYADLPADRRPAMLLYRRVGLRHFEEVKQQLVVQTADDLRKVRQTAVALSYFLKAAEYLDDRFAVLDHGASQLKGRLEQMGVLAA